MKKYSSVLVAVLGVLVGILSVLTYQKATENKRLIRTEFRDWRKLNLVLQSLDENYVDTIDRKAVTDAAITAALGALDPHSVYMPPAILEESETELAGNFDGIGIQFNVPNDTAIVLEVIPGGPSEKIGLQPGDRILKVDEKPIAGVKFPQDSMVRKMRGPSGTKVKLTVLRDGETVPFEITRGKIPMNSLDAAFMVNDTTGYLRLSKFARTTYLEVAQAADKLLKQGMKRLVFDLRDNGGGFFDQAFLLADLFLQQADGTVHIRQQIRVMQHVHGPVQVTPGRFHPDYIPVADDPCQNRRYTAGPGYSHEIFFFMIYHPLGHGFPPEKTGGYLSIPLPFVTVCDQTTVLDLFLSSISFCFCSLLSFLDILP